MSAPRFGGGGGGASKRSRLVQRKGAIQWITERWLSLTAGLVAAPLLAVSLAGTLYWPGKTFPGFFLMGNGIVPTVGLYGWTGIRAGVPFHARVVAVDGQPVRSSADVYQYVASLPVGTTVTYTLTKQDQTFERTVPSMRFGARDYWLSVGLLIVFGIIALGTGVGVGLLQPRADAARAFLLTGFFTGLFAITGTTLYHPGLWRLSRLHFVMQAAFPASFIHLGLVFPVERRFVGRHRSLMALPYAIAVLLAAWVFREFYAFPPVTRPLYGTYLYSASGIVILIGLVAFTYWENRTPKVRAQLRLVLPGLILGTAVGLFGFLNTARAGGDFPINLIAITPILFYLSVGYAIAKHELFDIDALVRQAVVYGTLTLVITAAYAGTVASLGVALPPETIHRSRLFNVAFVVLVALLFDPLRERIQRLVDRAFFRGRPDYQRTVGSVSAALTSLLDFDDIVGRVGRAVTEDLGIESLSVILWLENKPQVLRYEGVSGGVVQGEGIGCQALRSWMERPGLGFATLPEIEEKPTEPAIAARMEMERLGAALVIPLAVAGQPIGAFALGPKRSGALFNRRDIELLGTLAAQSAIALQNAHSYQALRLLNEKLEAKVRERTAELEASNRELGRAYEHLQKAQSQLVQTEKMAALGQLVAGVAHEINNPVSFIVSNMQPLARRVKALKEAAARHGDAELTTAVNRLAEVLAVIGRGAERTAGIVKDLRVFSRLGEHQVKPVDIHEGIEVSLRLLRPRWADRIVIHRHYTELPLVEADGGQINQALMNILANACEAIPGKGNIWITTQACEGSHVTITVRDDGVGMRAEDVRRIFEPFFTTKPIGKGTGLGLAISHGIIADHGGSIRASSRPGGGAEFVVILPLRQDGKTRLVG